MNELINTTATLAETKEERANALHASIMLNQRMLATALVNVCQNLKTMRDEKLYLSLGCTTFEQYTEDKAGIKSRQAYAYISTYEKLGNKFIEANESLGITKLELISQVSALDREEITESAEDMTVRELKEEVKRLQGRGEQLSFNFEQQAEELKQAKADSKKNSELVADLESKNKQLETELVQQREKTATAIDDAVAEKLSVEIDKALTAEREKHEEDLQSTAKELKQNKELALKLKQEMLQNQQEYEKQIAELEQSSKATTSTVDENLINLKLQFDNLQTTIAKIESLIALVADEQIRQKLAIAIANLLFAKSDLIQKIAEAKK